MEKGPSDGLTILTEARTSEICGGRDRRVRGIPGVEDADPGRPVGDRAAIKGAKTKAANRNHFQLQ